MLVFQAFRKHLLVITDSYQVAVRRTFAGQNLAPGINQRKDQRRGETLVFRLDVIDDTFVLYVSIEASYHNLMKPLFDDRG